MGKQSQGMKDFIGHLSNQQIKKELNSVIRNLKWLKYSSNKSKWGGKEIKLFSKHLNI